MKTEIVCATSTPQTQAGVVKLDGRKIDILATKVSSLRYVENQVNWCQKSLKRAGKSAAVAALMQKKTIIDIKRFIREQTGCGDTLLLTLDDGTVSKVFDFELCIHKEGQHYIGAPQYGLHEAILCLAGKSVIFAVPATALAGSTVKDKIGSIYNMEVPELNSLCERAGFVAVVDAENGNAIVVIPAGQIVCHYTASACEAKLVRWSFYGGPVDLETTIHMQEEVAKAYPAQNTDLMQALHVLCTASASEE